jgi:Protein of unknown function DUF262
MDSSATNQKISWFRKEAGAGSLDLSPKFQRRPVWTEEQESLLIDSILTDLPIPEIYIRSSSTPGGESKYEVVDGQQRIRAILKFGSNDLELVGDDVAAKWLNKRFDDLSNPEKTAYWDYRIVVRNVDGATDLEIRDLFKRLNLNSVNLNDQELRHAQYTGRFIKVMEALADDEWWLDSSVVSIRQVRRMEDVEFISELFVGLVVGPQDKKKTLDGYYANYDGSMPLESSWVRHFERTRGFLELLLEPKELRKWSGKSDFYTLFLITGQLVERKPKLSTQQIDAIRTALGDFRKKVDQAKRRDNTVQFNQDVHVYAEALTRAATDLGRRETRFRILEARLEKAISKKPRRKQKS